MCEHFIFFHFPPFRAAPRPRNAHAPILLYSYIFVFHLEASSLVFEVLVRPSRCVFVPAVCGLVSAKPLAALLDL